MSKTCKVLLMTIDFPPRRGGVARYLDGLARYFAGEVLVLAEMEDGAETHDDSVPYTVERTNLLTNFFWPQWVKTIWLFWKYRNRCEVTIVSHVLPIGTAAWVAGWFTRRPYTVIIHGMDIGLAKRSRWKRWLAKMVLGSATLVVANTEALAQEAAAVFGIEKTEVVYPCLSRVDEMKKHHDPEEKEGAVRLLSVARLVKRKGIGRVISALEKLRERGSLPSDWQYDIIGSGPMKDDLEKQIESSGLSSHIRILEDVDDEALWRAYNQSDVFVLPVVKGKVDREGFGMVYIEAGYFETPSIATQQQGVDEAVVDGETGMLVEDGDIDALANRIETLMNDESIRRELGRGARKRVMDTFDCSSQFEKLRTLFN